MSTPWGLLDSPTSCTHQVGAAPTWIFCVKTIPKGTKLKRIHFYLYCMTRVFQNLSTRDARFITPMVICISKGEMDMSGLGLSELGKTLIIKEVRQRMDRSQWGGMNGNTQPRVSCRWLSILSHSLWTWWAINPWMSERTESTQWLPLCQKRLWVVEMSSFVFLGSSEYNCRTEDKEGD